VRESVGVMKPRGKVKVKSGARRQTWTCFRGRVVNALGRHVQ